jgi:hypothetical protein
VLVGLLNDFASLPLPPVDCCSGTSPIHAARLRPDRNAFQSPISATRAVATIGPMPGIASNHRFASDDRCRATILRSIDPRHVGVGARHGGAPWGGEPIFSGRIFAWWTCQGRRATTAMVLSISPKGGKITTVTVAVDTRNDPTDFQSRQAGDAFMPGGP